MAGTRPRPDLPPGTDLLPQIRHIVILMMENHSYDKTDDHTAVLKVIEEKWNLPPLTRRDAAESPLDALDPAAAPASLTPPELPKPTLSWGSWST